MFNKPKSDFTWIDASFWREPSSENAVLGKPILPQEWLEPEESGGVAPFAVPNYFNVSWKVNPCSEIDTQGKPVAQGKDKKPEVVVPCPKCGQEFMGLVKEVPEYLGNIPKPPCANLEPIGKSYELRCGCIVSNAWATALVNANWCISQNKPRPVLDDYKPGDRFDRCTTLYLHFKLLRDTAPQLTKQEEKETLDYWLVITANRLRDLKSYGTIFPVRKVIEPVVMMWAAENKLYCPAAMPQTTYQVLPWVNEPKMVSQSELVGLTKTVTLVDMTARKKRTIRKIIE